MPENSDGFVAGSFGNASSVIGVVNPWFVRSELATNVMVVPGSIFNVQFSPIKISPDIVILPLHVSDVSRAPYRMAFEIN